MTDVSAIPSPRRRWSPVVPPAMVALSVATVGYGLWQRFAHHHFLGTPLAPFVMHWAPAVSWSAPVAALVWGAGAAWLPRVMSAARSPRTLAAIGYSATLVLGLALNAARSGVSGWWQVFAPGSREARFEYLPGLPVVRDGVHAFLAHFPQLLPVLPTHAKGNPPGTLLAIDLLGLTTPVRLAAACILVGALVTPLAYGLGRTLGGEERGRRAALLSAFSPAIQLFGVTSVDYVFAALGTATVWLLLADERTRAPRARFALGCLLAAVGSLASWLLLAMPACAVLIELLRRGRGAALRVAAGSTAAILAFNLALWLWQGYDPVAVVLALGPIYSHGAAAHRPYAFWLFGSPVAFAVFLGPPVAWLAARSVSERDPAAVALLAIVVVAAVLGFTKAETERIWLPFVPLACVAAAARPIRAPAAVLAAMAAQALLVEVLFDTIW